MTYFGLLWVLLVIGIVPAFYFVGTFRPRRHGLPASVDVAGLGAVVLLLYLRQVTLLAIGAVAPSSVEAKVSGIVFGVAIDALLWLRAARWWKVRRQTRRDP